MLYNICDVPCFAEYVGKASKVNIVFVVGTPYGKVGRRGPIHRRGSYVPIVVEIS